MPQNRAMCIPYAKVLQLMSPRLRIVYKPRPGSHQKCYFSSPASQCFDNARQNSVSCMTKIIANYRFVEAPIRPTTRRHTAACKRNCIDPQQKRAMKKLHSQGLVHAVFLNLRPQGTTDDLRWRELLLWPFNAWNLPRLRPNVRTDSSPLLATAPYPWTDSAIPLPTQTHDLSVGVVRGRDFGIVVSSSWTTDENGRTGKE